MSTMSRRKVTEIDCELLGLGELVEGIYDSKFWRGASGDVIGN